jgi:hypothetical protein
MASINQSSGQGALFELVARGVKDAYFVKDSKDSSFPYDARYHSSAHHLLERRKEVPIASSSFGSSFEVQIDAYADVLTVCQLEVELPSWYPQLPREPNGKSIDPHIVNGLYPITSKDGRSYGYVNYAGYFLFEKIQVFQDQFLLQEWSGDGLLALQMTEGSWNSSYFNQVQGGLVDGIDPITRQPTDRGIQLRATPNHIHIRLPLPGTQCPDDGGFPLVAVPWQTFRIKGILRKLEDLIVCSDPSVFKPAPWKVPEFTYQFDDGTSYDFAPVPLVEIEQPTLFLITEQHYVTQRIQQELRSATIQIPFRRHFENIFTFGELDYIPLDKGGVAAVTRRLDGRFPTERIFWFFRNSNTMNTNRLDEFENDYFKYNVPTETQPYTVPYGDFYYQMKLVIAGRDRESLYQPLVWRNICQLTKDEKASGKPISEMKWSLGDQYGTVYPAPRQPEGTVNFSTADRPTLYVELANITANPYLTQRKSEMRVYTEGWAVYEIKEGRGRMLFAS